MTPSRNNKLDRSLALGARPSRLPVMREQARENGGLRLTVLVKRPGWQRWLGGTEKVERTFRLDRWGRQVYEACDGHAPARTIVKRFAADNKLNTAEAELAVTAFLKTLMSKGLIAMEVDRTKAVRKEADR